jgi:hypothetical protein
MRLIQVHFTQNNFGERKKATRIFPLGPCGAVTYRRLFDLKEPLRFYSNEISIKRIKNPKLGVH